MLTEQQKQFCYEYLKDFTITAAMKRAGYAASSADKSSYRMLQKPEVAAFLKKLMTEHTAKQKLTAEAVLEEMRRLAFSDVKDFYKWSEKKKVYVLKSLDELTPDQTAAIKSYTPDGGYELYPKDTSLDKLAKYFKLYSEVDPTITNFVIMPELRLGNKKVIFDVGKPAPKRAASLKKD